MARTLRKVHVAPATRRARTPRKQATPLQALGTLKASAAGAVDSILRSGMAMQQKGRAAALARARAAGEMLAARAEEARSRTLGAVSGLEKVFEKRVSQAIARLGVPTAKDVRSLSHQVAELQQSVEKLRRSRARA